MQTQSANEFSWKIAEAAPTPPATEGSAGRRARGLACYQGNLTEAVLAVLSKISRTRKEVLPGPRPAE